MGPLEQHHASIYEEHLAEASFLYEQRGRYLVDPELALEHAAEVEARFEAHIDGLVLSADQGLAICREQIAGNDAGALHAALRVLCRRNERDAVRSALFTLADGEPAQLAAACDALCAELPSAWTPFVAEWLQESDARLLPLLGRAIGYRRLPLARELLAAVARADTCPAECAWALGELRATAAESTLVGLMWRGEPGAARAAAIALLKCGSRVGAGEIEVLASHGASGMAVPLALGERTRFGMIESLALRASNPAQQADGAERSNVVLALGLSGDSRAIPALLDRLADEEQAGAAAAGLSLLTGAVLFETAQVLPPREDGDAAGPTNGSARKSDDDPDPDDDGGPTTEPRLSRDRARWEEWLTPRWTELDKLTRLRMGAECSAGTIAAALASTRLPLCLRDWLGDELQIRCGIEAAYRADMPVREQFTLFAALRP